MSDTPTPPPAPLFDPATLSTLIATYKAAVADRSLSINDAFSLITKFTATAIQMVDGAMNATGVQKKDAVIQAVLAFYRGVIEPLGIPGVPHIIETTIIDPFIEREIPVVVGGIVDALVSIFRTHGVIAPATPAAPAQAATYQ